MLRRIERRTLGVICGVLVPFLTVFARADDSNVNHAFLDEAQQVRPDDVQYQLVQLTQQPNLPPSQPLDLPPVQPLDLPTIDFSNDIGSRQITVESLSNLIGQGAGESNLGTTAASTPTPSQTITAGTFPVLGATDAGAAFQESDVVQTVRVQRRSAVAFDPHIRGLRPDQQYTLADGMYWQPVRPDLDSPLGRIDSSLIQTMSVVPGPYGLKYGPGFGYISVQTVDTPRYENGFEAHNRMGFNVRTNGGQLYAHDTVYGGNADYGFMFGYGQRVGGDYAAGNGLDIPASYRNQNVWGQLGIDLSNTRSVEFAYAHLDQSDTEYPGQFFDIAGLVTDSWRVSIVDTIPEADRQSRVDVWYNRTRFNGTTELQGSKRRPDFPILQRVDSALGAPFQATTDGDLTSLGARGGYRLGAEGDTQLSMGADIRIIDQRLTENFMNVNGLDPVAFPGGAFETDMPRAMMIDPGLYAELAVPMTPFWTATMGGRVDWVNTHASLADIESRTGGGTNVIGRSLKFDGNNYQNDVLYAFYLMNDIDISQEWQARVGFGHAQRVPDLYQRYADGLFLGIIQSGFSRVIGNPQLPKERAWQIDGTLSCDYEDFRGNISGYHTWILDYTTYAANITQPEGARLLQATSTPLATLTGFEAYGEYDFFANLTGFAAGRYTDGRDREINVPLAQISPLEGRLGVRLVDPGTLGETWGVEFGARVVNAQNRLAELRRVALPGTEALESRTPGFTTTYIRGYITPNPNLHLIGGVDNLFDRTYLEHLDLRLPPDPANGAPLATQTFQPGITPYIGVEWTR